MHNRMQHNIKETMKQARRNLEVNFRLNQSAKVLGLSSRRPNSFKTRLDDLELELLRIAQEAKD